MSNKDPLYYIREVLLDFNCHNLRYVKEKEVKHRIMELKKI